MGFVHTVRRFAGLHEGLSDWHSMDLTMSCSSDCIFGCLIGQQSTFTVDKLLFVERKCTTSACHGHFISLGRIVVLVKRLAPGLN